VCAACSSKGQQQQQHTSLLSQVFGARESVCVCLCGAEEKKGERKGRMQLTTTSSMSII